MYHVLRLYKNTEGRILSFTHCNGTYTLEEAQETLKHLDASNEGKDEDGYHDQYVISMELDTDFKTCKSDFPTK